LSDDLDWTDTGPRSRRFGDVYFSAVDGLAESRTVYLAGAGLPDAWRGRRRFTVAELGFGTGLNIAALLHLWRDTHLPEGRLAIFSVEAYPITREAAARALGAWPELAEVSALLLAGWPDGRRGFHRIDLPGLNATLDLCIGEAAEALRGWSGKADAWLLDGFAPARNPEMWRDEVLALVAARSAPGARIGTFTVAGQVRRGLEAAGFAVNRQPGFGHKRQRLEAIFPGQPRDAPAPRSAVVVGAGIAGAALARALAAQGVGCTLLDAEGIGAGASGNPAALVTPRFDAGLGPVARLHAQAFARAVQLYRHSGAVIAEGGLQLETASRTPDRFAKIAAWDGFAPGALARLPADEVAARLDEADAPGALLVRDALVLEPRRLLGAWTAGIELRRGRLAALAREGEAWRLLDAEGAELARAELVVLATGAATAALLPDSRLRPTRGQLEHTDALAFSGEPAAWGGYAIPTAGGGVLFGATHGRDDLAVDLRLEERAKNLAELAKGRPGLAARVAQLPAAAIQSRAATRMAAPDHMPIAGAVPGKPGVHVLSGLGGRGYALAPLLAEHVAAAAVGAPTPLPDDLARLVAPRRFTT
jgi:tRNA 5-methylaminomethyl-2-thiouridine biosynthesis bifunctional protein